MTVTLLIGFFGGLREEEILFESIIRMIQSLGEARRQPRKGNIMVNLQGVFKEETGDKGKMLQIVYVNHAVLEAIKWVVR